MLRSFLAFASAAFLVTSPLTSYGDLTVNILRTRSSKGFSIDVCGIVLVSSLLRLAFWIGERFDTALMVQSLIMVCVQVLLLYSVLRYRSPPPSVSRRPLSFWQWSDAQTYWLFLGTLVVLLCVLQWLFGAEEEYVAALGALALSIEATLPIPQFLANQRTRSISGVRLSMIGSWVVGDVLKGIYFFSGVSDKVSLPFKACAVTQMVFDFGIAVQYVLWRDRRHALEKLPL